MELILLYLIRCLVGCVSFFKILDILLVRVILAQLNVYLLNINIYKDVISREIESYFIKIFDPSRSNEHV